MKRKKAFDYSEISACSYQSQPRLRKNGDGTQQYESNMSILFERKHFKNVCDIADHSKTSDTLTHSLPRSSGHHQHRARSCFVLCCSVPFVCSFLFSLLHQTIPAHTLSQWLMLPYFCVQIHPLHGAWH